MRLKTPKTQANPTTSFARRSRLLFIAPPLSGASRAHWSTNRNVARLARVPEPAAGLTLVLLGGALLLGSRDRSGGQAHHDHRGTLLFRRSRPAAGAVSTGASGRFRGEISKDGSTITYTLSYSGLEGTVEAHIHFAQRNVAGPIVVFLCRTTQSVTAPTCPQAGTVTGTLTAANLTIMAAGQGI